MKLVRGCAVGFQDGWMADFHLRTMSFSREPKYMYSVLLTGEKSQVVNTEGPTAWNPT